MIPQPRSAFTPDIRLPASPQPEHAPRGAGLGLVLLATPVVYLTGIAARVLGASWSGAMALGVLAGLLAVAILVLRRLTALRLRSFRRRS
jgi:hypothetical protein